MTLPVDSADALVAMLLHSSVLFSTRRCKSGWIQDPSEYYVCDVLEVTAGHRKKYDTAALK